MPEQPGQALQFQSVEQMLQHVLTTAQQLPPDQGQQLLRDFFVQKIGPSPWWQQNGISPQARMKVAEEVFGIPGQIAQQFEPQGSPMGASISANNSPREGEKNFFQRVMDRVGGGLKNPLTAENAAGIPGSGAVLSMLHNMALPARTLIHGGGEAIDTAKYEGIEPLKRKMGMQYEVRPDMQREQQLAPFFAPSRTPGGALGGVADMALLPQINKLLLHYPKIAVQVLRQFGGNVATNRAAAAAENANFRPPIEGLDELVLGKPKMTYRPTSETTGELIPKPNAND